MAAGLDDTRHPEGNAEKERIEARHEGRDMRQVQINGRYVTRARRHRDDEQFLALDARDPDIARAKQLQAADRVRTRAARGESTA
jgi:hypothetical protein